MEAKMDMILYEDSFKWDLWLKLVLAFSVVLLLMLGILFYIDAQYRDIVPSEPAADSRAGAIVLFACTAFTLVLFWAIFPRRLYILEDRVRVKFGAFSLNIPFETIEIVRIAKGLELLKSSGISAATSLRNQVEIVRKKGGVVRVSPNRQDSFLESLEQARAAWRRRQSG